MSKLSEALEDIDRAVGKHPSEDEGFDPISPSVEDTARKLVKLLVESDDNLEYRSVLTSEEGGIVIELKRGTSHVYVDIMG